MDPGPPLKNDTIRTIDSNVWHVSVLWYVGNVLTVSSTPFSLGNPLSNVDEEQALSSLQSKSFEEAPKGFPTSPKF